MGALVPSQCQNLKGPVASVKKDNKDKPLDWILLLEAKELRHKQNERMTFYS